MGKSTRIRQLEADVVELRKQLAAVFAVLASVCERAGIPVGGAAESEARSSQPSQRELDDAVAEIIRDARREFGP